MEKSGPVTPTGTAFPMRSYCLDKQQIRTRLRWETSSDYVALKSAGDSDTNAHLCHIGGADFLLLGARWQGGVQSVREGVQLTEYLQIKPKLIHFT